MKDLSRFSGFFGRVRRPFARSAYFSVFCASLLIPFGSARADHAVLHDEISLTTCVKTYTHDPSMSATVGPLKITTTSLARGNVYLTCTRPVPARFDGSPMPITFRISGKVTWSNSEGTGGAVGAGIGGDEASATAARVTLASKSSGATSRNFSREFSSDGAVSDAGDGTFKTVISLSVRDSWNDTVATVTFSELDLVTTTVCGDADGDGAISVLDALLILRRSVGQDVECPPARCAETSVDTARAVLLAALRQIDGPASLNCPLEIQP